MPTMEEANARKMQIEESMRALDYYKEQNEEALRQALKKDEAVKKHTKATSKDAIKVRALRSASTTAGKKTPRRPTRRSARSASSPRACMSWAKKASITTASSPGKMG